MKSVFKLTNDEIKKIGEILTGREVDPHQTHFLNKSIKGGVIETGFEQGYIECTFLSKLNSDLHPFDKKLIASLVIKEDYDATIYNCAWIEERRISIKNLVKYVDYIKSL